MQRYTFTIIVVFLILVLGEVYEIKLFYCSVYNIVVFSPLHSLKKQPPKHNTVCRAKSSSGVNQDGFIDLSEAMLMYSRKGSAQQRLATRFPKHFDRAC